MRITTQEQVDMLFKLFLEHKEDISRGHPVSEKVVYRVLMKVLVGHPDWFGEYVETNGEVIGVVLGLRNRELLTDRVAAQELVVYIRPDKRGSPAALRQIVKACRNFEQWAIDSGCEFMRVCTYGRYVQMLKEDGYRELGIQMVKEFV